MVFGFLKKKKDTKKEIQEEQIITDSDNTLSDELSDKLSVQEVEVTEDNDNQLDSDTNTDADTDSQLLAEPLTDKVSNQEKPHNKEEKKGYFSRLKAGLAKTGAGFSNLFLGKKAIDEDLLEELETALLMADVGIESTQEIIDDITDGISRKALSNPNAVIEQLKTTMNRILAVSDNPLVYENKEPFVMLMVGINGAGKTTTIGKITQKLKAEGKSVMLAAGDTFRAAAVEQLKTWGERADVPVIAQGTGADSASVIYDAYVSAKSKGVDVLIADTAGRLHTQTHLMSEIEKIVRVLRKHNPETPHEVMLVVDAGNGQNALNQAKEFNKSLGLTGITVTKLDGTAKGGIIFPIAKQLGVPVRYIGVGESAEDLREFNAKDFIDALLSDLSAEH